MDILKKRVVDAVFVKVKQLDGDVVGVDKEPIKIEVMKQIEDLKLQLFIKTSAGLRFFLVTVKESY